MQTAYRYWATIVFLAVVVQIAFAGYGAFGVVNDVDDGPVNQDKFDDDWGLHTGFGYIVLLSTLVLLVIALLARVGRRRVLHAAGLFGLLIVQVVLAWVGGGVAAIGALHPVNALVIFALSGWIARTAWRGEGTLERVAGGA